MFISLSAVLGWLLTYRYFILFPLSIVEGPILTILVSSFAPVGLMNIYIIFPVVIAGEICGDAVYYFVGRSGSGKFVERFGHYIGITRRRVEKLEKHFGKHAGKTLIISKLAHFMGGVFMTAAGMAKVPYRKFFWSNLIAAVPKTILLMLVGYYFGRAYVELSREIDYVSVGVLLFAILLLAGYLFFRRKTRQVIEGTEKISG